MQGFLNIDKPYGISSHDVVYKVRKALNIRKVGHAGTLDPLATGVLVVGIGRATRLIEYVMGQPKEYVTTIRLGQTTNTYDAEGVIEEERYVDLTDDQIQAILPQFTGTIQQIPPMYSAIKKDGQPLYKLARAGETVEIPARTVNVPTIEWLGRDGNDITLRMECSTGTYIRSLGHDIGNALGVGGHLVMLRRTAVGAFTTKNSLQIADITADKLLSPEIAVTNLPRIDLTEEQTVEINHGRPILIQDGHPTAETVAVYTNNHLLGLLQPKGNHWQCHKIFN